MYQNILVAVDLSKVSEITIKKALDLKKITSSRLDVAYILKANDMIVENAYSYAVSFDFQKQISQPIQKEFENFCEKHQIKEENRHFIEGMPKEEILKCAEKLNADLIIVGGHSHTWLGMLGSVADAVVNRSKCDVLVVRGVE